MTSGDRLRTPMMRTWIARLLVVPLLTGITQAQVPGPDRAATPSSTRTGQALTVSGLAEFHQPDVLIVSGYRLRAAPGLRVTGKGVTTLGSVPLGFAVVAKGIVQADGAIAITALSAVPRTRSNAGRGVVSGALDQEAKWLAGGGAIFRAALAANSPETRAPKADPQYERVREILTRMAPGSLDDALRLHIVNSPDWNARGLPNGAIAVASGLLTDLDDDEVAIVLGHELAHITHQHAQKTLADAEHRKLVTQLVADVMIPQGGLLTQVALTVGGAVALKAWQSGYSRSLETEADRVGLGYAAAGGFDIRKAPRVWERFRDKYGNEQAVKNFVVGDHPRNTERAKNAREELLAHYPGFAPSGTPLTATAAPGTAPRPPSTPLDTAGSQLASGTTPALPAAPATVEITQGMTQAQVRALLGAPVEEFVFTTSAGRQIKWIFAHMKVTFLDGRVTAVEF